MSKLAKINKRNPLARDLAIYVYPLNERQIYEAVYGDLMDRTADQTPATAPTIANMKMAKYGRGVGFTGTESVRSTGPQTATWDVRGRINPNEGTIGFICEVHNVGPNAFMGLCIGDKLNDGDRIEANLGQWEGQANWVANWVGAGTSTDDVISFVNGDVVAFIVSWRNGAGNTGVLNKFTYKISGGTITTSEETGKNTLDGTRWNTLPLDYIQFGVSERARFSVAAYWNRALSYDEMQVWADNPWQVLEAPPIIGAHQLPTHVDYATVKVPWTSQPPAGTPIDWTHPLATGLKNFVVFEGNFARDYARDLMLTVTLSGSDYEMAHHKDFRTTIHRAADTDATHYGVINPDEVIEWIVEKQYSALTQTCWIGLDSQATSWDRLVSWANDAGSANHMGFYLESSGIDKAMWMIHGTAWNSSTAFYTADNYLPQDGVIRPYSGVWNKDKDSGAMRFYREGQYHSISTETQTGVSDTTQTSFRQQANILSHKSDGTASTYTVSGELGAYMIHERDLSDIEVASLHANPWQIFKPREIMVPINEDLPDLVTWEEELTDMPWRPPL